MPTRARWHWTRFLPKFWHNIKLIMFHFFDYFANLRVDVERFNRSHMILLPKKDSARTLDSFRPISLQNCPPKAIAKLVTNRIKPLIPLLVHADQTGFLSGRNISENFLYAADILHCCAKRKAPSLIINLDFWRAFDSVCWTTLLHALQVRGFPLVGATGFTFS